MLASGFYHNNLRVVSGFHMLGLGDPLRGDSFRMMQNLIADFVFVQTINESFRYFHQQPPMQIITFQGDLYSPHPAQDLIEVEWTKNRAVSNALIHFADLRSKHCLRQQIGHRRKDSGARNIVKYG